MARHFYRSMLTAVLFCLASCGDPTSADAKAQSGRQVGPDQLEAALIDQIRCERPPLAGVAFSAMLRRHLIAETSDGGDGIKLFIPVRRMTFLGFEVVRLSGWQAGADGGAAPPFYRGPGTSPPNHISITVRASEQQVRDVVTRLGITEEAYVPDHSQNAWVTDSGEVIQPRRVVPGISIESGDMDLASNPQGGVTTLSCSADDYDFRRKVEADFGGATTQ